jgi:hypothetical protein
MNKQEIIDAIALTNKVINNPTMPEAVKEVATKKRADLQDELDALGDSSEEVETEKVVKKTIKKEVATPKKEKLKVERKPRTPKTPTPKKEAETETPESRAEKSMEGKKLSVANCRELLAKLKTRREGAKKRVATRKKQGKPAELTTIEVLKKASDTLETKVQTEVNKQGKLQKTTIKRSTKEVVDIVATIVSGIPTKAERTEYINEVIADLKKLIDKVEPITEKMAHGGMMADGGMMEARFDVTIYDEDGEKYYLITYAEDEEDAIRKTENYHEIESVDSDVMMITDYDGKNLYFANGGMMADGGLTKDSIKRTLTKDTNQYFLQKDGNGYILYITPKGAMNSTFHEKFKVEDLGNDGGRRKYRLTKEDGMMAKGGIFNRGPLQFRDSIQGSDGNYHYSLTFQPLNNLSTLYIEKGDFGKNLRFFFIPYSIVESFAREFQDLMDEYEDDFTETDWSFEGEVKSAFHDDKKYGASSRKGMFTIFVGDKSAKFESEGLMQSLAESFIELYEKVGDKGYDDQEYAKGGMMADGGEMGDDYIIRGVTIFDNNGESFDRYTVFTPDGSVYGMSSNPKSPQGFNMYIGDRSDIKKGSHLGKKLKFIPKEILQAVVDRMNEDYAKGGMMADGGMTKDFSGNYFSTNDFVGSNGLKDLANKVFGKGWKAEDDVDQIAELANHAGLKYVVIYAEDRSEWNKYRQIDTAHPTNDSSYDIFVISNEDWKKYVNDSEGDSDYDDEEFAKGGSINNNLKYWRVEGVDYYDTKFVKEITTSKTADEEIAIERVQRNLPARIQKITFVEEIPMIFFRDDILLYPDGRVFRIVDVQNGVAQLSDGKTGYQSIETNKLRADGGFEILKNEDGKLFGKLLKKNQNNFAKGGYMDDGDTMAHGGMIDESTKNQIDKGFTKKSFNEILNELFPYNFGFKVFKPLNRQNILTPNYDEAPSSLYGYDDSQIKSKLHFDQYKRDHAINFAIEQGGENTYYYFLLGDEEGNEYVGTFGFKDQGDVDSSYVTRFIAFLMECYGLPFEVKHSVN